MRSVFENVHSDDLQDRLHADADGRPLLHHDPILTPFFTSLYASAGFSGSLFGASAASVLGTATSAVVMSALTVGLNALLNQQSSPSPESGKLPLQQSMPYRQWVVGRARVAGAYVLFEAIGSKLFAVQAIAGHRIRSVNRYFLHDDEVTLDPGGYAYGLDDGRYAGSLVWIGSRLGLATETAYANVVDAIGSASIWSSDHRGDGQASLAMIATNAKAADQMSRFPYGAPRLSAEIDGALVYDPRDNTQSVNDPTTWKWSRNAALVMLWHQCFNEFGHRRDFSSAILPVIDEWMEEADVCDEDIPTALGAFEKRYEVSGFDTADNDPKIATNAIMGACDGWLCERGDGALLFRVGKFREALVETLTDRDIIGYQLSHDVLPSEEINRLIPKFTYPATGYATADTDYFEDTGRQVQAGRVLAQEGSYLWCQKWRQARRLGKRDWLRIQEKKKGSLQVRLSGINAVYARWIRLSSPLACPSLDGAVLENRRAILSIASGGFSLDFIRHPDNIDAWDPATDEGASPPVPSAPSALGIDSPVIVSVVAQSTGASVYLLVTLANPGNSSLSASIAYRLADAGGGIAGGWVQKNFSDFAPDGSGNITFTTDVVPGDQDIDVEAAWIASNGKYSNWSAIETVHSTSDPNAPGDVAITSVDVSVSGRATIHWNAPNSPNYVAARLYHNTVNNPSTATPVSPTEAGAPNGSYGRQLTLSAGTHYAWVRSLNASGVAGNYVATGAFTVA